MSSLFGWQTKEYLCSFLCFENKECLDHDLASSYLHYSKLFVFVIRFLYREG